MARVSYVGRRKSRYESLKSLNSTLPTFMTELNLNTERYDTWFTFVLNNIFSIRNNEPFVTVDQPVEPMNNSNYPQTPEIRSKMSKRLWNFRNSIDTNGIRASVRVSEWEFKFCNVFGLPIDSNHQFDFSRRLNHANRQKFTVWDKNYI